MNFTPEEIDYMREEFRERATGLRARLYEAIRNKKSTENPEQHFDDIEKEIEMAGGIYNKLK